MKYLLVFLAVALAYAKKVDFINCGSEFEVTEVFLDPCSEDAQYCPLIINDTSTISIKFKATRALNKIRSKVYGVKFGVDMPFVIPQPLACTNQGLECPLVKDKEYTFSRGIFVSPSYPRIAIDVKWILQEIKPRRSGGRRRRQRRRYPVCVVISTKLEDKKNGRRL